MFWVLIPVCLQHLDHLLHTRSVQSPHQQISKLSAPAVTGGAPSLCVPSCSTLEASETVDFSYKSFI